MARMNTTLDPARPKTHEGAPAKRIGAEQELRRTLLACMLWEDTFYEDGKSVADRIRELVPEVEPEKVAAIAIEARSQMHLRHAPLYLVREMARNESHRPFVRATLASVIQRADELAEFLAMYWGVPTPTPIGKKGRKPTVVRRPQTKREPIAASVKKGLADAFKKFNAYALAKYNRDGQVKLRDVLFLSHPKPSPSGEATRINRAYKNGNGSVLRHNDGQGALWASLVDGTLEAPDTWEVAISATKGEHKDQEWTRLLIEKKLGPMALIRNLRNMTEAKVDHRLIRAALVGASPERVLPFRFLAAVRHAPQFTSELETMMLKCLEGAEKLAGHTVVLVDISGSMDHEMSGKSEMKRMDAATGLAVLAREICHSVTIASFSDHTVEIPAFRGLGLSEAVLKSQSHNGTDIGTAVKWANRLKPTRIICLTDEQSATKVGDPFGKGYMINVASYQNGVGYGKWTHLDGFSEKILDFIRASEGINGRE